MLIGLSCKYEKHTHTRTQTHVPGTLMLDVGMGRCLCGFRFSEFSEGFMCYFAWHTIMCANFSASNVTSIRRLRGGTASGSRIPNNEQTRLIS